MKQSGLAAWAGDANQVAANVAVESMLPARITPLENTLRRLMEEEAQELNGGSIRRLLGSCWLVDVIQTAVLDSQQHGSEDLAGDN